MPWLHLCAIQNHNDLQPTDGQNSPFQGTQAETAEQQAREAVISWSFDQLQASTCPTHCPPIQISMTVTFIITTSSLSICINDWSSTVCGSPCKWLHMAGSPVTSISMPSRDEFTLAGWKAGNPHAAVGSWAEFSDDRWGQLQLSPGKLPPAGARPGPWRQSFETKRL